MQTKRRSGCTQRDIMDISNDPPRAGQRPVRTQENRYKRDVHRWGLCTGKTKRGKCTRIIAIADASGLLVAVCIESASPHQVKFVEKTIDIGFTPYAPDKRICDKAYDSDPLDQKLMKTRCIEMLAPYRMGRKKPKTQGDRKLRPYRLGPVLSQQCVCRPAFLETSLNQFFFHSLDKDSIMSSIIVSKAAFEWSLVKPCDSRYI